MSQPDNLLDHFLHWEHNQPQAVLFRQPIAGMFVDYTWQQAGNECRRIASALKANGLQPGDKVAILSKNCAHWIMADLAIMMAGCVSVPIYPTLPGETVAEIVAHSGSKAIFTLKLDNPDAQVNALPNHVWKIGTDLYKWPGNDGWEQLCLTNEPLQTLYRWKSDEVFTIIYTSGTTGKSKGVMHKCSSMDTTFKTVSRFWNLPQQVRMFSYLPLSHIAERMAVECYSLHSGNTIYFAESLETFAADLVKAKPQIFIGVPRIWTKFREGVLKKMPQKKLDRLLSIPLFGGVVRKKVVQKLGLDKAQLCVSGAAPISPELQLWFRKLGIDIMQAYGMTEDCVYAHMNNAERNKPGAAGMPLPGLQVKFTNDGELCVKSPGNFVGYYRDEEATNAAFDDDGFLKTGDIAHYDEDGFLWITGRVKDVFKTDKGKFVSPSPIELEISKSPLVEQTCVVGAGLPQPICLVVPSESARQTEPEELKAELVSLLHKVNTGLQSYEKLHRIIIMPEAWSIENNLLTPSLKIKRHELEKRFKKSYGEWYDAREKVFKG